MAFEFKLARVVMKSVVSGLLLSLWALGPAQAQQYPAQPIRLIVPYPPGGTTDILARRYADLLSRKLGKTVVVDNRPGASTNIAGQLASRAAADGYTLYFGGSQLVANTIFGPFPAVDPVRVFDPVAMIANAPFVVAANPKEPYSTAREMIAAARAKPGVLTLSHSGIDTYAALLNQEAKINLLAVPYKGGAPAVLDAMSGQVNMSMGQPPAVMQELISGKLKPIGVASKARLAALPNVPTFRESGAPDVDLYTWFAVFAPHGTPSPIIARLTAVSRDVVNDPAMQKLSALGLNLDYQTPDQLGAVVRDDLVFWRKTARATPSLVHEN